MKGIKFNSNAKEFYPTDLKVSIECQKTTPSLPDLSSKPNPEEKTPVIRNISKILEELESEESDYDIHETSK
jgi:hypothetical protein